MVLLPGDRMQGSEARGWQFGLVGDPSNQRFAATQCSALIASFLNTVRVKENLTTFLVNSGPPSGRSLGIRNRYLDMLLIG
jgi:hypothetical protein